MNKLRQARLSAGLTLQKMSEKLNIPYRTIQDWELDRRTPPKWAEALVIKELNSIADSIKLNHKSEEKDVPENFR